MCLGRSCPTGADSVLVGMWHDLPETPRQEEQLRRAKVAAEAASDAKSIVLRNMRHEICTPMHVHGLAVHGLCMAVLVAICHECMVDGGTFYLFDIPSNNPLPSSFGPLSLLVSSPFPPLSLPPPPLISLSLPLPFFSPSPPLPLPFISPSLPVPSRSPPLPLPFQSPSPPHSLPIPCPFPAHSLPIPCPFSSHSLPILFPFPSHPFPFPSHSLPIPCPFPAHSLPFPPPIPLIKFT
ncbi:unnamed protein product [Closterium sp. NIES-64]|nr:unnamed protein product [Closterium sp. NIES-64]